MGLYAVIFISLLFGEITLDKINMSYQFNIKKEHCSNDTMFMVDIWNKKVKCSNVIKELYLYRVPFKKKGFLPDFEFFRDFTPELHYRDIIKVPYKKYHQFHDKF